WLRIGELKWLDSHGRKRTWELCERINSRGATMIVAVLKPDDKIILVRQFRPPAARYVIEFPAGLIDPGETAAETASRELSEETGYHGNIIKVCEPAYSSPGMSAEQLTIVHMEIDAVTFAAGIPEPCQEDSEDIETIVVSLSELQAFLNARIAAGDGVDSRLLLYADALAMANGK
ncbi:MAG: NUDIX hydrolase, partial [Victivallales bacterium]|nr:NUDIX hydrolase [Victivallales bacterium]